MQPVRTVGDWFDQRMEQDSETVAEMRKVSAGLELGEDAPQSKEHSTAAIQRQTWAQRSNGARTLEGHQLPKCRCSHFKSWHSSNGAGVCFADPECECSSYMSGGQ